MPNTQKQGTKANNTGHIFEDMMLPIFKTHGFLVITNAELKANPDIILGVDKYVVRNVPFTTIYDQPGKTEFVIYDASAVNDAGEPYLRAIRVEAKWQQSAGSVDEKYPYMLLNGIYGYPEHEIIFVVDGGGYKPGARQWLADHINDNWLDYQNSQSKTIKLMKIDEFVKWFNNEF